MALTMILTWQMTKQTAGSFERHLDIISRRFYIPAQVGQVVDFRDLLRNPFMIFDGFLFRNRL
jgi:hypothetical protein